MTRQAVILFFRRTKNKCVERTKHSITLICQPSLVPPFGVSLTTVTLISSPNFWNRADRTPSVGAQFIHGYCRKKTAEPNFTVVQAKTEQHTVISHGPYSVTRAARAILLYPSACTVRSARTLSGKSAYARRSAALQLSRPI